MKLIALLPVVATLVACAAAPGTDASKQVAADTTQVCSRESELGQAVMRTRCRTAAQAEQERRNVEAMRDSAGGRSATRNPGGQ